MQESRSSKEPGALQSYNKQGFFFPHCLSSQGNSLLQEDAEDKNSQQFRKGTKYLWKEKNPSTSLNTEALSLKVLEL